MCSICNTFRSIATFLVTQRVTLKFATKKVCFVKLQDILEKVTTAAVAVKIAYIFLHLILPLDRWCFHRINFFHKNVLWKVYLNMNYVGFELVSMEQF